VSSGRTVSFQSHAELSIDRGDHSPAYIYKLVNEAYDEADVEL
jgi:hypothetical protein